MNRQEVITLIKKAGEEFCKIRAAINGFDYALGYNTAVDDMAKMFADAPLYPTFDAEREGMLAHIKALQKKNEELEQKVDSQNAIIQKLLSHVDVAEVLGVSNNPKKAKAHRRGVAFVFRK